MKGFNVKKALILAIALIAAGCSMPAPTGPAGSSSVTVSTLAGQPGVIGSANGTGTGATFWDPAGMVYVAGNIYVADSGNSTIRKIDSGGNVTVFAGFPGVASYFDNISNPTLSAYFNHPEGITSDGTFLYVADSGNNVIRRVNLLSTPVGLVDTLAGNTAGVSGFVNGSGTGAAFNNPLGICWDGTNLYVADSGNSAIRQIVVATTAVTTLAGSPSSTTFFWPEDITFMNPNLYVADAGYSAVFHVTTPGGVVTVLAGTGAKGDVDGPSSSAQFDWPEGITNDGTSLYVADTLNSVVRKISAGTVSTLAGQGLVFGSADGAGNAALFNHPMKLLWVAPSSLYVADAYNQTVRRAQPVP